MIRSLLILLFGGMLLGFILGTLREIHNLLHPAHPISYATQMFFCICGGIFLALVFPLPPRKK